VEERDGGLVETVGGRAHALGGEYGGGPDFGPTPVPEDKYLVLGDNRGNSADGRFFGWVDRDAILGRAVAICLHDGRPTWKGL
jgi:signal peptidase I